MPESQLDSIDWKILGLLQADARMSNVDLAKSIGLSLPGCPKAKRPGQLDSQQPALDATTLAAKSFFTGWLDGEEQSMRGRRLLGRERKVIR